MIATHTQARYALPKVITEFKKNFPKVHLKLHQAGPNEIVTMLLNGEADIGVATEALADVTKLDSFPYYSWHHAVIVPAGHPLEKIQPLTLSALAEYPIVTYHEGLTGRAKIDHAFAKAAVVPDISMSALDSDVIKTYVGLGLGIGIIASMAFNPVKDSDLRLLSAIICSAKIPPTSHCGGVTIYGVSLTALSSCVHLSLMRPPSARVWHRYSLGLSARPNRAATCAELAAVFFD